MENKSPLHSKIKELRKDKGWTQGELADKIGSDARMISQYEKGKTIPSIELIIKIAEIFNVSLDYILIENAPKRPLNTNGSKELIEQLGEIDKLSEEDKNSIIHIIKSLITKNQITELATKAN